MDKSQIIKEFFLSVDGCISTSSPHNFTVVSKAVDSLIDRTIAACIAKVPEEEHLMGVLGDNHFIEGMGFNRCRTLMLEGIKELQHD